MSYTAGARVLEVLTDVSLAVNGGEVVCVSGSSGSGKSTLLNIAAGLLGPKAGEALWRGRAIYDLDETQRDRERAGFVGMAFQAPALLPSLNARENVALASLAQPRARARFARARSSDLLAQVGLTSRARHFPAQLSGGEQQRVAVARALFADPALLILDEPTAALDKQTAKLMTRLITSARSKDRGVLIASHDPQVIEIADRVISVE